MTVRRQARRTGRLVYMQPVSRDGFTETPDPQIAPNVDLQRLLLEGITHVSALIHGRCNYGLMAG